MDSDEVRVVTTPGTPTAVIAETTSWDAFPARWRMLLADVWEFLRGSGLTAGRNVIVYRDDAPSVEVGAEVDAGFAPMGRVVPSSLPAGRAAITVARGAPSPALLGRAHARVLEWCTAHGHAVDGVRWEIYGHWAEDQDPDRFETEVYWLLEPARDGGCSTPE